MMDSDGEDQSGCEWMDDVSDDEGAVLIEAAKQDCPELMKQMGM